MSNKVTVAAIQMTYGLEEACEKVREAASQGAQIILPVSYTHLDVYKRQPSRVR